MLRRRRDGGYEFRQVERLLSAAAPPALTPERREALRLRIMAHLGEQDPASRRIPAVLRERWVAIPAGIGVAAAILAANHLLLTPGGDSLTHARASGEVLVNGRASTRVAPGDEVRAITASWIGVGDDVTIGLDAGTSLRYFDETTGLRIELATGKVAVAARRPNTVVIGNRFNARLRDGGTLHVDDAGDGTWVTAAEGTVEVRTESGMQVLRSGDRLFIAPGPGNTAPPAGGPASPGDGGTGAAPEGAPAGAPTPSNSPETPDPAATPGTSSTPGTPSATPPTPTQTPTANPSPPEPPGDPTGTPSRTPSPPAEEVPTPPEATPTPPIAGGGPSPTPSPPPAAGSQTATSTPAEEGSTATSTPPTTAAATGGPTENETGGPGSPSPAEPGRDRDEGYASSPAGRRS